MADLEEITIELDETPAAAAPEAGEPAKPAAAAPEKPIVPAEEGIEALKSRLAAEQEATRRANAAAAEANRRAAEAAEAAKKAQGDAQQTNIDLVTNAIEARKQTIEMAKAGYVEAMQAGDFAAAADRQADIAAAAADLRTLEHGLVSLKAAPPAPTAPAPAAAAPPPGAALSEAEKAAQAMDQAGQTRSAAWVRARPNFVNDPRLYRRLIAAHNLAETDGIVVDSPEYIDHVERTLGLKDELPGEKPLSDASDPEGGRRAASTQPPAAPVARGNGGSQPVTRITLSPEEREAAAMNGMTDEEYARNKAALIKEGRYGRAN